MARSVGARARGCNSEVKIGCRVTIPLDVVGMPGGARFVRALLFRAGGVAMKASWRRGRAHSVRNASGGPLVGRRQWLEGAFALTGASLLGGCYASEEENVDDGVCNEPEPREVVLPASDWFRGARVAGLAAFADATPCDFRADLERMADERVTVVEVDSELSTYLDEAAFAEQLRVVDLVARECHALGMRCVAYYPVLESLTPDADTTPHTMAKDHPDWLQRGMDGKPNVFVGGGGRVFWVAAGEESAWLCPTSGYVDYFNARVAGLARTALDGLWGDVPLLSDIVGVWPCTNGSCNAKFAADTGLTAPTVADWNDPRFAQWVAWRHRLIWDLEQRIVESAKRTRADFEVIIETVTMDYSGGTAQGLDGAYADDGRIYRVWEIDAVSDASAMRGASTDDWLSMAVMMKHARGASAPRPAWAFCYGLEPDDAELTMGLAIATGCSPYETRIPEINTSVGSAYRKRMFEWLERHPQLLLSRPASSAAVLYSSTSRDVLDRAAGVALYTSTNPADPLWWTTEDEDSAADSEYVADYRGFCKMLFQSHVPFEVLTTPHVTDESLAPMRVIVAPSPASLAQPVIEALVRWVEARGTLVLTGAEAGERDEHAAPRGRSLLLEALAVKAAPGGWADTKRGAGRVLYSAARDGRAFFRGDERMLETVGPALPRQVETNAPENLLVELRTADTGELVVAFANLVGLGAQGVGALTPQHVRFRFAVDVGGRAVARITLTAPGIEDEVAPFDAEGTKVACNVTVAAVAAAIVTFV